MAVSLMIRTERCFANGGAHSLSQLGTSGSIGLPKVTGQVKGIPT